MPNITITCPVCYEPDSLEVNATVIQDTEGDSSIPNGTRTFLSLDDYEIDWGSHNTVNGDNHCQVMWDLHTYYVNWTRLKMVTTLQIFSFKSLHKSNFEQLIADKAINYEYYYDGPDYDDIPYSYFPEPHI